MPRQLLLEPAHIRQLAVQFGEPARQFAGLRPGHQAGVSEALPGEQRTWIDLAARRDIAVSDDPVRGDAVALGDVLQQGISAWICASLNGYQTRPWGVSR